MLQTAVGLCVFLAYGTTAAVSRRLGAGDLRGALAQGIDGVWLAALIGMVGTVLGLLLAPGLVEMFDAGAAATAYGLTYLWIALWGMTPLLVMLATTGVLRGLQDTRTPLLVALAGNLLNIVLNIVLVYPLGLGIAGSAIGTVTAQALSATALLWVVVRGARREGAPLLPDLPGVRAAGRAGVALVVRTLALRAALLTTVFAVTIGAGADATSHLAANQIAFTVWTFLAFVLDAVAIAAQALTGRSLGAGDVPTTQVLTRRMIAWGLWSGVVCGLLLALVSPWLGALFTADPAVRDLLVPVLLVAAAGQPIAGVVFVLDGVLIGAGDGRYLAWSGLAVFAVYAPVVLVVGVGWGTVLAVWTCFTVVFMGARLIVLTLRARGDAWMVTGV